MNINVKVKNADHIKNQIANYQVEIHEKLDIFVERLAQKGVEIAVLKVVSNGNIFTGTLLESIQYKPGDVVTDGITYIVYTDCPWAKWVEFGTGIVGEEASHPDAAIHGWEYDTHKHGEAGWYYTKGEYDENNKPIVYWTKGQRAKAFMYETARELFYEIQDVALEVFGR